MLTKQFEIWVADLNPQLGTETGKTKPVDIIQINLLNKVPHPSTIICPITTNGQTGSQILRVKIAKGTCNLHEDCDIMIDQMSAIDNKLLLRRIGSLPVNLQKLVKEKYKDRFGYRLI